MEEYPECQKRMSTEQQVDCAIAINRAKNHCFAASPITISASRDLTAPSPSTSAASPHPPRDMNVNILIRWGLNINIFLEKQKREVNQEFDSKQVDEKFGWVTGFCKDIEEWGELLDIVTTAENFVRTQGLCTDSRLELEKLLSDQAHTEQTIKVREELLNFV